MNDVSSCSIVKSSRKPSGTVNGVDVFDAPTEFLPSCLTFTVSLDGGGISWILERWRRIANTFVKRLKHTSQNTEVSVVAPVAGDAAVGLT